MTDTPAESAEAPRTPEEEAAHLCGRVLCGDDEEDVPAIARAIRIALAALNAQWKQALLQYEGCAYWIAAEQHSCAKCAPLRALLSEGKPGQ
jgi:hypothetical protein